MLSTKQKELFFLSPYRKKERWLKMKSLAKISWMYIYLFSEDFMCLKFLNLKCCCMYSIRAWLNVASCQLFTRIAGPAEAEGCRRAIAHNPPKFCKKIKRNLFPQKTTSCSHPQFYIELLYKATLSFKYTQDSNSEWYVLHLKEYILISKLFSLLCVRQLFIADTTTFFFY